MDPFFRNLFDGTHDGHHRLQQGIEAGQGYLTTTNRPDICEKNFPTMKNRSTFTLGPEKDQLVCILDVCLANNGSLSHNHEGLKNFWCAPSQIFVERSAPWA